MTVRAERVRVSGANSASCTQLTPEVVHPRRFWILFIASLLITCVIEFWISALLRDPRNVAVGLLLAILCVETAFNLLISSAALVLASPRRVSVPTDDEEPAVSRHDLPLVVPLIVRTPSDVAALESLLDWIAHSSLLDEVAGVGILADLGDSQFASSLIDHTAISLLEDCVKTFREKYSINAVHIRYRGRSWNPHDMRWMGWERKRGKIVEFLHWLRRRDTSFIGSLPRGWESVQLVAVMDIDSRPEPGCFPRLARALKNNPHLGIAAPILETSVGPTDSLERLLIEPNFFRPRRHQAKPMQLVFGNELFNGKGVLRVDTFLEAATVIPESTILSHDHLEALLVGACSVAGACVLEPFPRERRKWEARQHRWFRGDTQLAFWGVLGRSRFGDGRRYIANQEQLSAFRIATTPLNHALRYLAVLTCASSSLNLACGALFVIALTRRDGLVDGSLAWLRALREGEANQQHGGGAAYHLLNSALRSIGEVLFFQRIAFVALHAVITATVRMSSASRRGMLEWFPRNASLTLVAIRLQEASLVIIAGLLAILDLIPWAVLKITLPLLLAPYAVAFLSGGFFGSEKSRCCDRASHELRRSREAPALEAFPVGREVRKEIDPVGTP